MSFATDRDVFLDLLANALTGAAGLGPLQGRIYKRHVSQIREPEYPCLTIWRRGPGQSDEQGIIGDFDLYVGAWSESSSEAWRICAAAHRVLNRSVVSTSADVWTLLRIGEPFDILDAGTRPVHQVVRLYAVTHITAD